MIIHIMIALLAFICGVVCRVEGQLSDTDPIGKVRNITITFNSASQVVISWDWTCPYIEYGSCGMPLVYVATVNFNMEKRVSEPPIYYKTSDFGGFVLVEIYAITRTFKQSPTSYASRLIPRKIHTTPISFEEEIPLKPFTLPPMTIHEEPIYYRRPSCHKIGEKHCLTDGEEPKHLSKPLTAVVIVISTAVALALLQPLVRGVNTEIANQSQQRGFQPLATDPLISQENGDDSLEGTTPIQQLNIMSNTTERVPPSYEASEQDNRPPPSYDATVLDEIQFSFVIPRVNPAVENE